MNLEFIQLTLTAGFGLLITWLLKSKDRADERERASLLKALGDAMQAISTLTMDLRRLDDRVDEHSKMLVLLNAKHEHVEQRQEELRDEITNPGFKLPVK